LDVRGAYANFVEIEPITYSNALRTGFIDGFFLPQPDAFASLGRQHQYLLFAGWHPPFGDVTFDYAEDTMRRPAALLHPEDTVSYDNPESPHATALLTLRRTAFGGIPSALGGPSPNFTATSLVFEQRYRL
jgi:hypothetical protein